MPGKFFHVAESGRPGSRKAVGLREPKTVTTSLEGFAGRAVAAAYRTVYRERVAPDRHLDWVLRDGVRVSFENSTVCRAIFVWRYLFCASLFGCRFRDPVAVCRWCWSGFCWRV